LVLQIGYEVADEIAHEQDVGSVTVLAGGPNLAERTKIGAAEKRVLKAKGRNEKRRSGRGCSEAPRIRGSGAVIEQEKGFAGLCEVAKVFDEGLSEEKTQISDGIRI
jgi:hypothetical protein